MSEILAKTLPRLEIMKKLIRRLHEGAPVEEVRLEFQNLVRQTDAREIAIMEQQLLAEGLPVHDLCQMCDLHSQVVMETLPKETFSFPPGHPVDTFSKENRAILQLVQQLENLLRRWQEAASQENCAQLCLEVLQGFHLLQDIDKHYKRKEYLLFPILERHGITGPSQVMWAKDDQVRQKLSQISQELRSWCSQQNGVPPEQVFLLAQDVLAAVVEMVNKEERILLPMAVKTLTPEEWAEIWQESPQFGWCLVEPGTSYQPSVAQDGKSDREDLSDGVIPLPTGRLRVEQLLGLLRALPVDITFVDEDDRVVYFSDGPDRIFDRNVTILGRKVQHCHPPKSVHVVEQILNDFRSGRQSVAEFWINFRGKFVHIRYFAVRDPQGKYLGTLEVTQDVTRIRTLEGERRLLQYDS